MMSETAMRLLATFDSMPVEEQHELLIVMLRRSGELPDAIVSDDQLVRIADEHFQMLDAEESNVIRNNGRQPSSSRLKNE